MHGTYIIGKVYERFAPLRIVIQSRDSSSLGVIWANRRPISEKGEDLWWVEDRSAEALKDFRRWKSGHVDQHAGQEYIIMQRRMTGIVFAAMYSKIDTLSRATRNHGAPRKIYSIRSE